ncbi:MAG: alanine racemase [Acutalibacteraceae bacterium]
MSYYRCAALVDLDKIEANFNAVKEKVGEKTKVMAIIKADAYGHGAVEVAKLLENKCDFFGVADIDEALEIKHSGITTPVIILGRTDPYCCGELIKKDTRFTVTSLEDAKMFSEEAAKKGKPAKIHIAVDTGMSRIGFQVEEVDKVLEIAKLPFIEIEGVFSHYATADEKDLTKAEKQRESFIEFTKKLSEKGLNIPIKHMSNSAGIMNFSDSFDMVRAGIVLYGLYPSDDVEKSYLKVLPALKWVAKISFIKLLPEDREISYGGIYKTDKPRLIATVPVGYADGYPRCLSNIGEVLVGGKRAPIVGRVCMDQFMIDVTDIDGVEVGSEVTLFGTDKGQTLSIEEISGKAHSFNYELICRISRRIPRLYYKDGKQEKAKHYLLD